MTGVKLIETEAELAELADRLRPEPLLAVDTEAASFHRYRTGSTCSRSRRASETAVVDPLATGGLGPIGELLADPAIEIVFHDADYDLRLLDREYGFTAHEPVRHPGRGPAPQRAGYRARRAAREVLRRQARQALPAGRLVGAAAVARDARVRGGGHPPPAPAARLLRDQLIERGRLGMGGGRVRPAGGHPSGGRRPGEPGLLRIKGAKALRRRALAVLREVWEWREEHAAPRRPGDVPHPQQRADAGDGEEPADRGRGAARDSRGGRGPGRAARARSAGRGEARARAARGRAAAPRPRRRGARRTRPTRRGSSGSRPRATCSR